MTGRGRSPWAGGGGQVLGVTAPPALSLLGTREGPGVCLRVGGGVHVAGRAQTRALVWGPSDKMRCRKGLLLSWRIYMLL